MTTPTTEIAAITAYRHHFTARPKMLYGFALYWANIDCRENAIGQIVQSAITVHMCLTEPSLTMPDLATPETQVAARGSVFHFLLKSGRYELILLF